MQTQLKISNDRLDHFIEIAEFCNKHNLFSGCVEITGSSKENDSTVFNLEFGDPSDLFELGILFSQVKPDIKLDNQTTLIPDGNRGKPSFKIDFK